MVGSQRLVVRPVGPSVTTPLPVDCDIFKALRLVAEVGTIEDIKQANYIANKQAAKQQYLIKIVTANL